VEEALTFTDAAGWDAWLAAHHGQATGVWVKVAKKGSPHRSITAAEAGEASASSCRGIHAASPTARGPGSTSTGRKR